MTQQTKIQDFIDETTPTEAHIPIKKDGVNCEIKHLRET